MALWHFEELEKAIRAGEAEGLRSKIGELAAPAEEGR